MTPLLDISNLAAGYGDRVIVEGISLTLSPGELVGILGGNGVGKSTILRSLYGKAKIMAGQVMFEDGQNDAPGKDWLRHHRVAVLLQGHPIFPSLTVRENVLIATERRNIDRQARLSRVLDSFPELSQLLDKPAGVLSGGERQIVGICRLLATDARLWLVDEPGAGLNPSLRARMFERLRNITTANEVGVLLVEQHVKAALEIVDRFLVLHDGRQAFYGRPSEVTLEQVGRLLIGSEDSRNETSAPS